MTFLGAWLASRAWRSRFSFVGKVVVISGGSRGLGLILARLICREGRKVVLLARDSNELERAKAELTTLGGEVLAVQCDLAERSQIQAAVAEILQCYGKIDVLFNKAGIIRVGPVENMRQRNFAQAMSVHFWAPLQQQFAFTCMSGRQILSFTRHHIMRPQSDIKKSAKKF